MSLPLFQIVALVDEQENSKLTVASDECRDGSSALELIPNTKEIATQTRHSTKNVSLQFRSKGATKGIFNTRGA